MLESQERSYRPQEEDPDKTPAVPPSKAHLEQSAGYEPLHDEDLEDVTEEWRQREEDEKKLKEAVQRIDATLDEPVPADPTAPSNLERALDDLEEVDEGRDPFWYLQRERGISDDAEQRAALEYALLWAARDAERIRKSFAERGKRAPHESGDRIALRIVREEIAALEQEVREHPDRAEALAERWYTLINEELRIKKSIKEQESSDDDVAAPAAARDE